MLKEKPSIMNKIGRWGRKAVMVATAAAVIGTGALSWTGGAAQAAPGDPVLAPTIKDYTGAYTSSYVLMENGDLYGMGQNIRSGGTFSAFGQGASSAANYATPVKILSGVKDYRAGYNGGNSNFALMKDGSVMYWGYAATDAPYTNSTTGVWTPTKIDSPIKFEKMLDDTTGIKMENGVIFQDAQGYLYGLGRSSQGTLGKGTANLVTPTLLEESKVGGALDPDKTEIIFAAVGTNNTFFYTKDKDAAGAYHLYYKGKYMYGSNSNFIDGSTTMVDLKTSSQIPTALRTDIASGKLKDVAGYGSSIYMITDTNGSVYASGANASALGIGTDTTTIVPLALVAQGEKEVTAFSYTTVSGSYMLFGSSAYYIGTAASPATASGSTAMRVFPFAAPAGMTIIPGMTMFGATDGKTLRIAGRGEYGTIGDGNVALHTSGFTEPYAFTKEYLQAEYDKAPSVVSKKITKVSLNAYQQKAALAKAKLDANIATIKQSEINTAATELYAARQALVAVPKDGVYTKLGTQLTYYTPDQFNSMSLLKKSKLIDKLAAGSGTLTLIDGNQYANLADLKAQRLAKNAMKDYTAGLVDDTKYTPAQ